MLVEEETSGGLWVLSFPPLTVLRFDRGPRLYMKLFLEMKTTSPGLSLYLRVLVLKSAAGPTCCASAGTSLALAGPRTVLKG